MAKYLVPTSSCVVIIVVMVLVGILMDVVKCRNEPEVISDPHTGILEVRAGPIQGSCVVVARRNDYWYAVTAKHVVQPGNPVIIDREPGETIRMDPDVDLALVRFKSDKQYRMYTPAKAKTGEPCTAVGWSGGDRLAYKGHVVSTDAEGHILANGGLLPGCSGGALLNKRNELIGVASAVYTRGTFAFDTTTRYVPARFAESAVVTIGD